jgi:hypothetical protein
MNKFEKAMAGLEIAQNIIEFASMTSYEREVLSDDLYEFNMILEELRNV